MRFKLNPIQVAILTCLTPAISYASNSTEALAPVIVTADLRETSEQDIPASVTIQTQADLQDQGATHFDDILLKTPNVNFSGQSSRARHIQIRGMGERDEYTGAPNSSVGFAIDDIDFSGIGMTGNLFDVKQVEVLRGPQNTRYGPSAIAGLINIQTNEPTDYRESMVETSVGQDNLREIGVMTSGPFSSKEDAPQYRVSVFKHGSDGFRTNETLDRTDTNGRDELTLRGKLRLFPDSNTTVDVSVIHADLNNGYDVWSRDNTLTTQTNEPGKDALLSNAAAVKVVSKANPSFVLTSKTSLANSDLQYGFDADWQADDSRQKSTFDNDKHRRTLSQELRWNSSKNAKIFNKTTDWTAGIYASHLTEQNHRNESYAYPSWPATYNTEANSDYTHNKLALYGQMDQSINSKTTIIYSLRVEKNQMDFSQLTHQSGDDGGAYDYELRDDFTPDENLWGGSIQYLYKYNDKHTAFAGLTRGYKAGGFNAGIEGSANTEYASEALLNYEIGLNSDYQDYGLKTSTTFFYMDRKNPQFDGYVVENYEYAFFTENFDHATNYGVETEFNWKASPQFTLYGSLGLIQTDVSGTPVNSDFTITEREQAHAPNYQANFGGKYRNSAGLYAQADITAVDKFYFDNVHNFESEAYQLINARIGYEAKDYEIYVWGKNLTDETYSTRGFQFDHYDGDGESQYIRLGDPRQLGITGRIYF